MQRECSKSSSLKMLSYSTGIEVMQVMQAMVRKTLKSELQA